jgi:hypothetical protein
MSHAALSSLAEYSHFIAESVDRPAIVGSTLIVWSDSPYTGVAEGEILFVGGFRIRLREELDFHDLLITSYGYEVYHRDERLYWYDDFPHPNDPSLASSFPHHRHVPPEIKHNRIPAPEMSFDQPNLTALICDVEGLISNLSDD